MVDKMVENGSKSDRKIKWLKKWSKNTIAF